MSEINKDSLVFQFMLKEYEMLYGKIDMHYQAVEKSITFYFVLIGAVISLNGLVYSKSDKIQIFNLSGLQNIFLVILCVLGLLIYFKVIEHRLLIIAYVKSLNLNRKWFLDNSEDKSLGDYLYFKASVANPKFYKKFRHFYWEAAALSTINSLCFSVLIINLFVNTFNFTSNNAIRINFIWLIILTAALIYFHLLYYKLSGNKKERIIKERFKLFY
jgi:hypothetical protein